MLSDTGEQGTQVNSQEGFDNFLCALGIIVGNEVDSCYCVEGNVMQQVWV